MVRVLDVRVGCRRSVVLREVAASHRAE